MGSPTRTSPREVSGLQFWKFSFFFVLRFFLYFLKCHTLASEQLNSNQINHTPLESAVLHEVRDETESVIPRGFLP